MSKCATDGGTEIGMETRDSERDSNSGSMKLLGTTDRSPDVEELSDDGFIQVVSKRRLKQA